MLTNLADREVLASETVLKAQLCRKLELTFPKAVVIRNEDPVKIRSGIPDISFTWQGTTSWIEGKRAIPKIRTAHKIQIYTMLKLAATSNAFYVVWAEKDGVERTFIVSPTLIHKDLWDFNCMNVLKGQYGVDGIDHNFIIDHLREIHHVDTRST